LTGEPPFAADTLPRLMMAHLRTPPPRPSVARSDVPAQVDEVIATGMAKDPDQRYATTIELADAARDAITEPIQRLAANPTRIRETQPAHNVVTNQPATVKAASPAPVKSAPPPPGAAPPIPAKAGGIRRRTTIALVMGLFAVVAVIVADFGIPALVKHITSGSSPTSSSPPTSSERSYGAQIVLPFTGLGGSFRGGSTIGPTAVAVDTGGNLYVVDTFNSRVVKLAAGSTTQSVLSFTGLYWPYGVAVDTAGALYVTDRDNNRVLKLAAGSATQTVLPFTGLHFPNGVAVDAAGNLYVTDGNNNRVLKLAASSTTQTVLPFTGLNMPFGVAVDVAGNVYVVDNSHNRVLKLPVQ
jgi:serine/threonine-protein kinase